MKKAKGIVEERASLFRQDASSGLVRVRVLIEARVRPTDIGFLNVGQGVSVKLSSYVHTIWLGRLVSTAWNRMCVCSEISKASSTSMQK